MLGDYIDDDNQGFLRIPVEFVDQFGTEGVIEAIRSRIGSEALVYLSIDIDVLDPAFAPGKICILLSRNPTHV